MTTRILVRTHGSDDFATDFATMSGFGATPAGGVDRQAATAADGLTRDWLSGWFTEHGFTRLVDPIGNLFGLAEYVPGAPYVLVGSHLDSQPRGGRYDGAYGVLAAAHAVARVTAAVTAGDFVPKYNLAVVDWFNEEGSRFEPSMMGSGVFCGRIPLDVALATADRDGVTVAEALGGVGYRGTDVVPEIVGCAEIHIEQGHRLEDADVTIGLVESNWAAHKYRIVVRGEQSHTGSTPMEERRDALLAAAHIVVAAREVCDLFPTGQLHSGIGLLEAIPNSPVVVNREARLHLDMRSPFLEVLDRSDAWLRARFEEIEKATGTTIDLGRAHFWDVEPYHDEGVAIAERAAADLGLTARRTLTLAGHDSTNLKDLVPTVMLFIPSVRGISHNEHEYTAPEDCEAGVRLLAEVLARQITGVCTGAPRTSALAGTLHTVPA
ncbi:M20 family metallo-hydrolase [Raineyella sp. W15-4]|uniref:M20 family metallo-hydrolase n=1 Tax=Raineyella sp. W15-4 TaxID=3081651 RepID=UPI0029531332|nr:M20 family metallo-hydrolase [Raineyella sp. W15-4]WOQ17112.1 M20 family metallo-hydrolase [Raineyella sp. W15-4]